MSFHEESPSTRVAELWRVDWHSWIHDVTMAAPMTWDPSGDQVNVTFGSRGQTARQWTSRSVS